MIMLRHCLLIAGLVALAPTAAAQDNAADTDWLVEVLRLRPGSTVADIGAGRGELTIAVAPHVAPGGRVYSSELGTEAVQRLRRAVARAGATNVTVVEGDPNQTNLPEQCCDAVFLRYVYHHFADPPAMNASLWRSLKPGGRLAVIEFSPRGSESKQPSRRASGDQHGITAETLVSELRQAGFELISAEGRRDRDVYVVVQKPVERD